MAVIRETEFNQIVAIYEQQADECLKNIMEFHRDITKLAEKTKYEPLVHFTNQICIFYKEDLRRHLNREFNQWYESEYSLHALTKNIGAGASAVSKARGYMDKIGNHLKEMFRNVPDPIKVDTEEPEIEDEDFKAFSNAISRCIWKLERANQNALFKIQEMSGRNNAVACITEFVKTLGINMEESFRKMIEQVDEGLGLFKNGVIKSVNNIPDTGKAAEVHIPWGRGVRFL